MTTMTMMMTTTTMTKMMMKSEEGIRADQNGQYGIILQLNFIPLFTSRDVESPRRIIHMLSCHAGREWAFVLC